jgi:hypothetical protein
MRTQSTVCLGLAVLIAVPLVTAISAAPAGAPGAVPTFSKDVAPILFKNCTTCHRPGEIAPMSLLTYEDARPYAEAMIDELEGGTMPPWHADPKVGHFRNDRRISDADKATILTWAKNGAPKGNPADLPAPPKYIDGWTIGQPNVVLEMPVEYKVPEKGQIEYEYFELPTRFTEDKWVQAIEVRAGNRAVVHHVIVYTRAPQPERRPAGIRYAEGMDLPDEKETPRVKGLSLFPRPQRVGAMIGGFAPGTSAMVYDPGSALLIRAGSTIVLQMHYTANGKGATDRTRIGMILANEPPKVELRYGTLVNGAFKIPAGAESHEVTAEMTTTADITVRQMLPHTHLRGKDWQYTATYPDGRSEVILSVPKYDFNWQTDYVFAEPLKLPKGTRIRAVAHYDNSAGNRSNPNPKADVTWGDQTWEEMMFTSFVYSIDGAAPGAVITTRPGGQP